MISLILVLLVLCMHERGLIIHVLCDEHVLSCSPAISCVSKIPNIIWQNFFILVWRINIDKKLWTDSKNQWIYWCYDPLFFVNTRRSWLKFYKNDVDETSFNDIRYWEDLYTEVITLLVYKTHNLSSVICSIIFLCSISLWGALLIYYTKLRRELCKAYNSSWSIVSLCYMPYKAVFSTLFDRVYSYMHNDHWCEIVLRGNRDVSFVFFPEE